MNWWPVIISGGTLLLVNVSIIIGYIRNHSKHIMMSIEALKESHKRECEEIKKDITEVKNDVGDLFSKVNANATAIAHLKGRLNNRK